MTHQLHRVKRQPEARIFALPQDRWQECVFIEADTGDEFVVVYAGRRMPNDVWPEAMSVHRDRMPAHGHSHRPRQTT